MFIAFIGQSLTQVSHFWQGLKFFKGLSGCIDASVMTTPKLTLGPYSGVIIVLGLPKTPSPASYAVSLKDRRAIFSFSFLKPCGTTAS